MAYERIDETEKFDGKTRDSHELRYKIASGFVNHEDIVLDLGCGVGYGEKILTKQAKLTSQDPIAEWIGLDKNPANDKIKYYDIETGDGAENIPEIYDVFVGLEIIEHLNDVGVENFVSIAKDASKWIVVSTPIVSNSNPFHKQQFTEEKILEMFIDENWRHFGGKIKQNDTYGIFIFKRQ